MSVRSILTSDLRYEHDVVLARQRARQIAALLGFDHQDQTRISTAVSEIARNAFQYGGGGKAEFAAQLTAPPQLIVTVSDQGGGVRDLDSVLDGSYRSRTGMGLGIIGAKRLMDDFRIDSGKDGTRVTLRKNLPRRSAITTAELARIATALAAAAPNSPFEEIQQQNRELFGALDELRARQSELARVNAELEETNRGVVALYAELDDRADYLQRASELKTRFLSNMSHEFRTPLNSIISLSRLLLDRVDGDLSPEQEKQVQFIQKSATDLSELVNDLLDLAKVEAGKITIKPNEFDVEGLFAALRGMLRPLLVQRDLNLVFDEPAGLPKLNTDEGKVSQILRNFLSNALKFTERGEVRVTAQAEGDLIRFAVSDTGVGIAPESLERVFEEWAQVDNPLQRKVKGTGLGLPLSRKLAELLGGRTWAESTPGVGSTFFLEIPLVYQGETESTLYVPQQNEDSGKLPVLVVEDNKETLFIYDRFLKSSPYRLLPARTLKEARRVLAEQRPVAIVLDILLEGESTWGFLSELKSDPATRDIPTLVVTVVDNERKARSMGATDFAMKPVDRGWLLDKLGAMTQIGVNPRVLVIDDDPVARYLLRGALTELGIEVLETSDGNAGFQAAVRERPQAIILDLVMPGVSGFETLERLASESATASIPVIVHSSKTLDAEERNRLSHARMLLSKSDAPRDRQRDELAAALATVGVRARLVAEGGSRG